MKKEIKKLSEIFKLLSNESRLCILTNLCLNGEKKVSELQICSGSSQSFVSQQLAKLKAMGVVEDKKIGKEVYYCLIDKEVCNIIKSLNFGKNK
jgi:ArsR family transcriptional regulator